MNHTSTGLLLTLLVIGHTLVEALHGIAHQQLGVGLSGLQFDYVLWVILITPLAAMSLFWAGLRAPGLLLLLTSMAGSLVFGLYYHFWFAGPDNALMVAQGNGAALFQATAIAFVVVEGLAYFFGLQFLLTHLSSRPSGEASYGS